MGIGRERNVGSGGKSGIGQRLAAFGHPKPNEVGAISRNGVPFSRTKSLMRVGLAILLRSSPHRMFHIYGQNVPYFFLTFLY